MTLLWGAPASGGTPSAYFIEAGSSTGLANLASFSTGSTATSFSTTGVASGTYFVRVKATNSAGTSIASNEAVLTVGGGGPCTAAPGPPGSLTLVVNAAGTVVLAWSAASGAPTTYFVEAGSATGLANLANSDLGGTATSFTATGVGAGTYFLRIRARNACGTGVASNEILVVVSSFVTETFTGRANCFDFHTFTMSQPGLVEAKFLDITGASILDLRLIEGVCPGSCRGVAEAFVGPGVIVRANLSAGTRTVSGGTADANLCSRSTTYTVQVTHPR